VARPAAPASPGPFHRFALAVHGLVRRVPRGRVVTYGQLARLLGAPRAARRVGQAMRRCPASLPWHRVVNAAGGISARTPADGMLTQRLLLQAEAVRFVRGRVDLDRHRWRGPALPAGAAGPRRRGGR
jgi:methylated-DNA-protein-cysteine methyltransferase-like protein